MTDCPEGAWFSAKKCDLAWLPFKKISNEAAYFYIYLMMLITLENNCSIFLPLSSLSSIFAYSCHKNCNKFFIFCLFLFLLLIYLMLERSWCFFKNGWLLLSISLHKFNVQFVDILEPKLLCSISLPLHDGMPSNSHNQLSFIFINDL